MDTDKKPGYGHKIRLFLNRELPAHVIIAQKALLLYILISYRRLFISSLGSFPFLPFLPYLDAIPPIIYDGLIYLLLAAIIFSFLKIGNLRLLSLISGSIVLFLILSSKNIFSNSLTFVACLLILISFYREKDYLFRFQIALLYIGAASNKIIDPDWWNGNYFDFFFRDIFDVTLYQSLVPEINYAIAKSFGIATIFTELLLGFAVLIPKITRYTIVIGLIFHASMLIITSGQLSNHFFFIMCVAFLLISRIHIQTFQLSYTFGALPKLISYLEPSESIIAENKTKQKFTLQTETMSFKGMKAITKLLFSKQIILSSLFILFLLVMYRAFFISRISRLIHSIF